MTETLPHLDTILFASADASARFALSCLEPFNGRLRAKSSFVKPDGEIMHWHDFGDQGFLTEGVDWHNHVGQRHHINEALYGAIQYTEPLLNNLHFLGPTLFYFEKTGCQLTG